LLNCQQAGVSDNHQQTGRRQLSASIILISLKQLPPSSIPHNSTHPHSHPPRESRLRFSPCTPPIFPCQAGRTIGDNNSFVRCIPTPITPPRRCTIHNARASPSRPTQQTARYTGNTDPHQQTHVSPPAHLIDIRLAARPAAILRHRTAAITQQFTRDR